MSTNHLEKLEAFLVTLINFKDTTVKKLEELKVNESVELSDDQNFTAIGKLAKEHNNDRYYEIKFKDNAGKFNTAIETDIGITIQKSDTKRIFISFVLQMVRYKYGYAGILINRDVRKEPNTTSLTLDNLTDEVKKFINLAKGNSNF